MSPISIVFDRAGKIDKNGLKLSPYDIPVKAVVLLDSAGRKLRVTFEYIDDERGHTVDLGNKIVITIGKHSGKILSLEAPVPDRIRATFNRVDNALEARLRDLREPKQFNQKANTAFVRNALGANSSLIETAAIG